MKDDLQTYLKSYIGEVADFPQAGILFRDITPLLANAAAFTRATEALAALSPADVSAVVGIEARGFIFGVAVAQMLQLPFVLARKPGKLPRQIISAAYQLEYGENSLQMHADSLSAGARVLIVDDLIATGGTLGAVAEMVESQAAKVVQTVCLIELTALDGRNCYGRPLQTVLQY